jgi:hypothetical protein
MNDLVYVFHETFSMIRRFSPIFISFLLITTFISILRIWKNFGILRSSKLDHDYSCNDEYDFEIFSLLCDSPKETIDIMYECDKEYLVDYFTEHLFYFYDDEEEYIDV